MCFAGLLAVGCARTNVQSEAAVRQGIINYLNTKSDLALSSMQVDVSSVSFRQNEADALVSFRPKGADSAAAMQIRYTLERKGNNWVVKGRGTGADSHSAMPPAGMGQTPPAGMGQMPPAGMEGMKMPPSAGASKLPEGHPPIGAAMPPATATPKK